MEGFQSWRILHLELETLLAPVAGASGAFSSAASARNSAALWSPKVDYCCHRRKTSCSVFKVICEDDSDNFFRVLSPRCRRFREFSIHRSRCAICVSYFFRGDTYFSRNTRLQNDKELRRRVSFFCTSSWLPLPFIIASSHSTLSLAVRTRAFAEMPRKDIY